MRLHLMSHHCIFWQTGFPLSTFLSTNVTSVYYVSATSLPSSCFYVHLPPPLLPPSLWVPLCAHISFQTGSSARHKEALFNLSKPGMRHKNVTREQRIQFFSFAGSETVSTQLNLSETNPCNQSFLSQSTQLAISFVKNHI